MSNYYELVRNVLSRTLKIQPDDNVIIETWDHGLPIAAEFLYRLREMGARPMLMFEHEKTYWRSVDSLPEDNLGRVGEHEWAAIEKAKAYVFIPGPDDLSRIWRNPAKFRASTRYNEEWYERAKRYRLKAARIGLGYASPRRARAYKLPLLAWQKMLLAASTVEFDVLRNQVTKLAPLMEKGEVKITATNGTDLNLRLIGREPTGEDCMVDDDDLDKGRNVASIPGGNILVCPDETYANGTVIFDRPTAYMGRWVGGIRLNFSNGKLTNYAARQNADHLKASYEKASGEKNQIAVLGIGLNPKARTGFLQDNITAGVVTVAIGGNDDLGGANRTDFYFPGVLTKATLSIDGNVIVQNGKLTQ
jgi:aminopeptidase